MRIQKQKITVLASVLAVWVLAGCSDLGGDHYVIAATGTKVGIGVSTDPATASSEFILGYKRGELAIVPTNRGRCIKLPDGSLECDKTTGNGAKDTTNVLMELKYDGNGDNNGIYQRLAVGDLAVQSHATTVMFARDGQGKVSADVAAAAKGIATKQLDDIETIWEQVQINGVSDQAKLEVFLACHDKTVEGSQLQSLAKLHANKSKDKFIKEFGDEYAWELKGMLAAQKTCAQ